MIPAVHTLVEVFMCRKEKKEGITFIRGRHSEEMLSYEMIFTAAGHVLAALQAGGVQKGDELVLQISDPKKFIICFWAGIMGGMIPVPLAVGRNPDQQKKVFNVWECLHSPYLLIDTSHFSDISNSVTADVAAAFITIKERTYFIEALLEATGTPQVHMAAPDDLAYIQFSSGSTSQPKGIRLTHRNILTNCKAILRGIQSPETGDSFLSWMPLTHDMGLIGYHLTPLLAGWHHYIMPTELFIRKPALWLHKISEHKITFTASPNFGYKYVLDYHDKNDVETLDLSSLRIITNGAEPISAELCDRFQREMAAFGLRKHVIFPVYGLAEASLAVTFSEPGKAIKTVQLDRHHLRTGDPVIAADEGITFVNVGRPLADNCELQLVSDLQTVVPEEVVGNIQIRGANVTQGYYNNTAATVATINADGWLDTGDLGFMRGGELYITGRKKEIIFINGSNVYPHDIEHAAGSIAGLELGKLAVAGRFNDTLNRQEIIAFVVHKGSNMRFVALAVQLRAHVHRLFQLALDAIIPVKSIPKTTSGKTRRYKLIAAYEAGTYTAVQEEIATLMDAQLASTPYEQPETALEVALYALWKTLLGEQVFGVTHSFFGVGGNSLNAVMLLSEIHAQLGVQLSFSDLYQHQSIRGLAGHIAAMPAAPFTNMVPVAAADYPLSPVQHSIYYFWATHPESVAYNIPLALKITGCPDMRLLEQVIRELIKRHEVLRTSFVHTATGPRQLIKTQVDFQLEIVEVEAPAIDYELRKRMLPFDLHQGPLFRIVALQLSADQYMLFMDFHHIIFDGISYRIFLQELFALYNGNTLAPLSVQYKDYAYREMERDDEKQEEAAAYWCGVHATQVPVIDFPADYVRPQVFNYQGQKIAISFDKATALEIKELARQQQMTPYVVFLSAYLVFLSKYFHEDTFVVGVPVNLRKEAALQQMPGMFVNNLAVKLPIDREWTFEALLKEVNHHFLQALEYREYPFDQLLRQLPGKRDISRNPLFDTALIYHDVADDQVFNNDGWQAKRYFFDPGISKYDFSLELFHTTDNFTCYAEYSGQLFKEESVRKLVHYFQQLLKSITKDSLAKIGHITISPDTDVVANQAPAISVWAPEDDALVGVHFEKQALLTPDSIAITDGEKKMTYRELNEYVHKLATELVRSGLQPEQSVGIMLERSALLITAILAVLKAGGCYVPIDPELPAERIGFLLQHSATGILITGTPQQKLLPAGTADAIKILCIDDVTDIPETTIVDILPVVSSRQLAYIIYTSGTTGSPKGVMIEHHSLFNYIRFAAGYYVPGSICSFPLFTSISFDLTITSIFVPLITGGQILIFREEAGNDTIMERIAADERIDIIKLTPSHLKMLKACLQRTGYKSSIKTIIAGGEALSRNLSDDITALMGAGVRICNEYGPTETTVGCMIHEYDQLEENGRVAVPIGKPISHLQVAILDNSLQPVPPGANGELYIMGAGLARGYLFNESFTSQQFISHPQYPAIKMYKTGDLATSDANGIIHYTGRADEQIKYNGYRIEPEEIVTVLVQHPAVKEAIVMMQENDAGASLCTYYTTSGAQPLTAAVLKDFLLRKLPAYMVPAKYIWLEDIPLTLNGKVNKALLPSPVMQQEPGTWVAPVSRMEQIIAAVWQEILQVDQVGMEDDFFEIGGDSIKAVQIASKLYTLDILLTARDILTCQTIARLVVSDKIVQSLHQSYEQGIILGERLPAPAEYWFFEQQFMHPGWFTQSVLLQFKTPVSVPVLQEALNILQTHHDGLRVNYNRERQQLFYNNTLLTVPVTIKEFNGITDEQVREICEAERQDIDIENGSLIKAAIIHQQGGALLFLAVHHLAVDGYSWRILLDDLHTVYTSLAKEKPVLLPQKTASLQHWSEHLHSSAAAGKWQSQQAYWQGILQCAAVEEIAELRGKHRMAVVQTVMGASQTKILLQYLQQVYKTDIETWLITCLFRTLYIWEKTSTFVIELEHLGRNLAGIDVSRTVGWFTNMFPVQLSLNTIQPVREQLLSVQHQLQQIPDDGIGYGVLKYINQTIESNNTGGIRFNYLGDFSQVFDNALFSFSNVPTGADSSPSHTSGCRIEINVFIVAGVLKTDIHYHTGIYTAESLLLFKSLFDTELETMVNDLSRQLEDRQFEPDDFDTVVLDRNDLNILFN